MSIEGGNGKATEAPCEGNWCQRGTLLRSIQEEQSSVAEELVRLSNRIGVIMPDGAATPHSLTSLVLDLGGQMATFNQRLNSIAPKVDRVIEESENTKIQSRTELIERARRAEQQLTARAEQASSSEIKEIRDDQAKTKKTIYIIVAAIGLLASGAGGTELVKQLIGLLH